MNENISHFDGHNDFLLRLMKSPAPREETWLGTGGAGHLDLARMKEAGFAGGLFAIFVPPVSSGPPPDFKALMANPPYDLPMPPEMDCRTAQPDALEMAGLRKRAQQPRHAGYGDAPLAKLAHENWLSCLERSLQPLG